MSSGTQLFHKPVGDVSSPVETLFTMADAIEHLSLWRVHGFLVELERAARIHDPIIVAVTDQKGTFDPIGSAIQREFCDLFSCFFEILGADQPT
jgi:hypothetical protein